MKTKQIRELTPEDLDARIAESRAKILEARIKKTASDARGNPLKVRTLRRDVARMLTVARERQAKPENQQQ